MEVVTELITAFRRKTEPGYGYQKETEALITHILNNMVQSNLPDLNPDVKNETMSTKLREKGNAFFVAGDDARAIEFYTKSLAYATTDEFMALARANRSAALFRKRLYVDCLVDVNSALSLGYPQEKAEKLEERGRKAMYLIQKFLHKEKEKQKLSSVLDDLHLREKKPNDIFSVRSDSEEKKDPVGKSEEDELKEVASISVISSVPPVPRYVEKEGDPKIVFGPSKETPATSAGLSIAYSKKYGRHIVATKAFRPGDVVSMEDPFAYILYRQRVHTHCQHCLMSSYNLIPCPLCPLAMYCSEKCKSQDWKHAHSTECMVNVLLGNMLNNDEDKINQFMKIIRLLIDLTKNGTVIDELREDMKIAETNPDVRSAGFTDAGVMDSSSARSALSLAMNFDSRPFKDISAFACIASLATILLATRSNIFGKKYPVDQLKEIGKRDDIIFCTSLMYRACFLMSSNSFSIQREPGTKCGSGLYVVHSLLNHACAPNTLRHFEGMTIISRALVPISPGEQIFTSYCGGFQFASRRKRRATLLENYFFSCDCTACEQDWPSYGDILNNHLGSIANRKEIMERIMPFKKRLNENKYDIEATKSVLEILFKEAKMPCEEMVVAMQYMRSYYLGKFYK